MQCMRNRTFRSGEQSRIGTMLKALLLHFQFVVWDSPEETSCLQFIGCAVLFSVVPRGVGVVCPRLLAAEVIPAHVAHISLSQLYVPHHASEKKDRHSQRC